MRRQQTGRRETVRIKDVAQLAGVSTATVSRVLAGGAKVSPEREKLVHDAVSRLGYRTNRVARRLRATRRRVCFLIAPDLNNPFFMSIARGVESSLQRDDVSMFLGNSDDDPERERRYIDIALEENVGGVVIGPTGPTVDISALVSADMPTVVIDQALPVDGVHTVVSDLEYGGRLAARELLEHGCRDVAAVMGPTKGSSWNERLRGLRKELKPAGGSVVTVVRGDNRVEGGRAALARLLDGPPFDAIFVSNNLMTIGVLAEAYARGLRIPQDISIVGFDVDNDTTASPVPITTVVQAAQRMGELAGAWIGQRIEGFDEPGLVKLPPELIRGASIRAR